MAKSAGESTAFRVAIGRRASEFGIVRWSPDGKWIAAAGGSNNQGAYGDGCVWIFDVATDNKTILEGHRDFVTQIAWSPDSRTIASGSLDNTARLVEVASGRQEIALESFSVVDHLAWSQDGVMLAGSHRGGLVVYTGGPVWKPRTYTHRNLALAWSPNENLLVTAFGDRNITLWDSARQQTGRELSGHSDSVLSLAWSPDGSTLASGSDDHTVQLQDVKVGRVLHILKGHSSSIPTVAWSPDGRMLASGSLDRTVVLWDVASGSPLYRLTGHGDWVQTVAWSPDGSTLASISDDETVFLWDTARGKAIHRLEGPSGGMRSIAWSRDSKTLATVSGDCCVRLWEAASGRLARKLEGHSESVVTAAWSYDGSKLASGAWDGKVKVWNTADGECTEEMEGHFGCVRTAAWSPDGRMLASLADDNSARLWDVASGQTLRRYAIGRSDSTEGLAWSPDGRSVATGASEHAIRFWDAQTSHPGAKLMGHGAAVLCIGWSRHGLASSSVDRTVGIWDLNAGAIKGRLRHQAPVATVAWSVDGRTLATGCDDKVVRLWDTATNREKLTLEGHEEGIAYVAWSGDGTRLASIDYRCGLRIWNPETGELIQKLSGRSFRHEPAALEFGATVDLDNGALILQAVRMTEGADSSAEARQILQASAKIVVAGDSDAGKTCLARRLAEDVYVEGQTSTHGMQVWTMAPEKLHPDGAGPDGQHRQVFLWDLGGQDEYQLVNQLFLRDTMLAMVVFDATRPGGLVAAESWHQRLTMQGLAEQRNLLVRTKSDKAGVVQEQDIEALRKRLGFQQYVAVSARTEGDPGVARLRSELHTAINWDGLTVVSRPPAFHETRELLAGARQEGEVVIFLADLERRLERAQIPYTRGELETTLGHLVREGQLVDVVLQKSRDRVLVLRIDVISHYAGALVQAARATRVPALALDHVLSSSMDFVGLKADQRVGRNDERTVIECVVRLMVERGICFDHQGLLVFPTLFSDLAEREGTLPPSAPLYYDFNGPIDNIYAALVARLAVSEKFGPVRLWARYAEFGSEAVGTFGIRRADKSKGRGHLDLFFSGPIEDGLRHLFRDFVDDHLKSHGASLLSGLAFSCFCGKFDFSEDLLRDRLADSKTDVTCSRCDRTYSLFAAAQPPTAESEKRLSVLKTDIEKLTEESARKVVDLVTNPRIEDHEHIIVLHLSDLHFTPEMKVNSLLLPLERDLRKLVGKKSLNYLVVSGDFSDKCNEVGWVTAGEFVKELARIFGVDALRIVIAPGNHDLARGDEYFKLVTKSTSIVDGRPVVTSEPVANEKYPSRFHRFAEFYHNLYVGKSYSEDPAQQFDLIPGESGLHFLALNSAWEVDQYYPERASLNYHAIATALRSVQNVPLGIAVWHHAAAGDRKIRETASTKLLAEAGFRIALHGDVHEERNDALDYLDKEHRVHMVGCGSFAAGEKGRPESTPRSYTLLRVRRDLTGVEILRRHQKNAEGPFADGGQQVLELN